MPESFQHLRLTQDEHGIAWLAFDYRDKGANVLSPGLFAELETALGRVEEMAPQALVFHSTKASGFIAGADVEEFTRVQGREEVLALIGRGQALMDRIEALPFPVIALLHGHCLGGGYELALACDHRIASADRDGRIGLPEVLLGIHPGFGGSARLVRLIGAFKALPLMLSGRTLDGRAALKLGLVDEFIPDRNIQNAVSTRAAKGKRRRRRSWRAAILDSALVRPWFARYMRRETAKKVREEHYPAPFALIRLWQDHGGNFRQMLREEGPSIAGLFEHPTTRRLIDVFFLQQELKKAEKQAPEDRIRQVHVIGAGVMGGDIAAWCALQGLKVTLQDREPRLLEPALKRAAALFAKREKSPSRRQRLMDMLIPDHAGRGVEHADLVIEAIVEKLEAKAALYESIEPRMQAHTLLATNTSSIPLEKLAPHLRKPERLLGIHFFNPVAQMQLVEIIRGHDTSQQTFERGRTFITGIGKLPLQVASAPGFLVNRVLLPYLLEAVTLLEEGVAAEHIDAAMLRFGMPMGPVTLADTVGLDICLSVAEILAAAFGLEVPALLRDKVAAGELGVKSGKGFYSHKRGKASGGKQTARPLDEAAILERLLLRLLNECVVCLREGIVADERRLDAGLIFGTGFPPFRGGPMAYLRSEGPAAVRERLQRCAEQFGPRFTPDPGWATLESGPE